jgi:protocatechuate 3,4-dioxygenase beta subunit
MTIDTRRRRVALGVAGVLLAGPALARQLLESTPRQTAGPFYPERLPLDDDNDLTRVRGRAAAARGTRADVTGRVLDVNGRPLVGVRVEIWQCDANGRYHHPRDQGGELDPNFQGFGHTQTDGEGRYRFRTIRPVPYPGRTPHIHFAVLAPGAPAFTTQLYVKGEPRNAGDFLFNHIPAERRHLVLAEFAPVSGSVPVNARFDIVLGGVDGTPGA